ncbi:Uncharacterised protein [Escherichia coli]|uniref:Uncharacterized protein n=1 Tax=Escherichia coli TaxID=562 RepID=A0A376ZE26_ECOLX|nr:Uncharacterised protein [Escherichia coli]
MSLLIILCKRFFKSDHQGGYQLDYKVALSISVMWIASQSLCLLTCSRGYRGHLAFPDGVLYDTSLYTRSYKFTPAQWSQERGD